MVEPLVVSPSGVDAIALGDNAAFEHNGVLIQYEGIGAGEVGRSLAFVRDPRFVGTGFFAGEAPDGLTTVYGDPISADVFVYWRDTDDPMAQEVLVGATKSAPDGTWCITGLNYNLRYVVRARASGRDDVTVVGVQPSRSDVISYVDHLEPTAEFDGLTGYVLLDSGLPPFTCEVIDPLPYGLSARIEGRKLLIEGVSSDAGWWGSMVRVTASNGVWVDVPVQVRIAWTPADLVVAPKIWLDDTCDMQVIAGAVAQWSNRGSIGGAFGQDVAAHRPTLLSGHLAARRVVKFDGVNDRLTDNSTAVRDVMRNTGVGWVFVVYKNSADTAGGNRVLFNFTTGSAIARFSLTSSLSGSPNRPRLGVRRLDTDSSSSLNPTSSASAGWLIARVVMRWQSGDAKIAVNGGEVAAGVVTSLGVTSNTRSQWPVSLGAFPSATYSDFADNELAVLVCGSGTEPSPVEWASLEGWAAHRYGLTDLLPADHPYKEVAP